MPNDPQSLPGEVELLLQHALRAGGIATWEWDSTDDTLSADATYRSLFGLAPADGPQPAQVYRAQMIQEEVGISLERARTALATGGLFEMDQRVVQRGGGVLWMLSCGRAKGDDPRRMIGISLDNHRAQTNGSCAARK